MGDTGIGLGSTNKSWVVGELEGTSDGCDDGMSLGCCVDVGGMDGGIVGVTEIGAADDDACSSC